MRHGDTDGAGDTALSASAVRWVFLPGFVALAAWWLWSDTAGASTADAQQAPSARHALGAVDPEVASLADELQDTMALVREDVERTAAYVADVQADVRSFDATVDASTAAIDGQIDREVDAMVASALDRPPPPETATPMLGLVDFVVVETFFAAEPAPAAPAPPPAAPTGPPAASRPATGATNPVSWTSGGATNPHHGEAVLPSPETGGSDGLPVTSRAAERTERGAPQMLALLAGLAGLAAGLTLAASAAVLVLSDGSGARPPTTPD